MKAKAILNLAKAGLQNDCDDRATFRRIADRARLLIGHVPESRWRELMWLDGENDAGRTEPPGSVVATDRRSNEPQPSSHDSSQGPKAEHKMEHSKGLMGDSKPDWNTSAPNVSNRTRGRREGSFAKPLYGPNLLLFEPRIQVMPQS